MIKCCLRRPENILSNHCSWGKKRIIGIHIDSYFIFVRSFTSHTVHFGITCMRLTTQNSDSQFV